VGAGLLLLALELDLADNPSYFKYMALTKDQIFKKLAAKFKDKDEKSLKEVSYNLSLASTVTESNLEEKAAKALEKLQGSGFLSMPLDHAARMKNKNKLSICPICKMDMQTVKLLEDRRAFYCKDHRIVVPYPTVTEEEVDL